MNHLPPKTWWSRPLESLLNTKSQQDARPHPCGWGLCTCAMASLQMEASWSLNRNNSACILPFRTISARMQAFLWQIANLFAVVYKAPRSGWSFDPRMRQNIQTFHYGNALALYRDYSYMTNNTISWHKSVLANTSLKQPELGRLRLAAGSILIYMFT